jgi:tetratricopeptide (TPR) repeat protein
MHAAYARALERRIQQRAAADAGAIGATWGGATAVEATGATALERGQLAYHWYAAHDLGEALLASVRAGQAAESASALAEALEHYERALELWDQAPRAAERSPLDRVTLLQRAAEVANFAGRYDSAIVLARMALDQIDPAVDPLRAGALLERLGFYHRVAGDSPKAMATIQLAVATIPAEPPSRELARALATHSQLLMLLTRHAQARPLSERAVAIAREVGDRAVEGHALTTLGTSLGGLGHIDQAVAHLEHGRRIARELRSIDDLCRTHANLATVLELCGRAAEAAEVYLAGAEVAREFEPSAGLAPCPYPTLRGRCCGSGAARRPSGCSTRSSTWTCHPPPTGCAR